MNWRPLCALLAAAGLALSVAGCSCCRTGCRTSAYVGAAPCCGNAGVPGVPAAPVPAPGVSGYGPAPASCGY